MKLLDLYKSILSVAGLHADKDGMISAVVEDVTLPFTMKSKRLVLPTQDQLRSSDWENRVIFHPLSENILRPGESEVLQKFRSAITIRLNFVLGHILEDLMVLATSTKLHKKLSPDQADLLNVLKDADERTLTNLQSILKSASSGKKYGEIVHLFLKKNGIVNGKKHSRAGIVTFPLYDEIINSEKSIYGTQVRNKDRAAYKALFEFIFPTIDTEHSFDRGSNDDVAPFLDSLMKSVISITGPINSIIEQYHDFITNADSFMFESDWVETFDNLATMLPEIRLIPMQSGNEGSIKPAEQVQPNQMQQPIQNVMQPVQQHFLPQVQQQYVQQPMQAMQPVQQNGVVMSSGGLDLSASVNNNPALRQQFMPQMNQNMGMHNRIPSWDVPANNFQQQQYPVNGYNNNFNNGFNNFNGSGI